MFSKPYKIFAYIILICIFFSSGLPVNDSFHDALRYYSMSFGWIIYISIFVAIQLIKRNNYPPLWGIVILGYVISFINLYSLSSMNVKIGYADISILFFLTLLGIFAFKANEFVIDQTRIESQKNIRLSNKKE